MLQDFGYNKNASYALIAMGSNLPSAVGRPKETILAAIEELTGLGFEIDSVSDFYQTPCFPAGTGPDFVNAVVGLRTKMSAADLLNALHQIENTFGRKREKRWGARTLDLDLLAIDQQIYPDLDTFQAWLNRDLDQQQADSPDSLILPHPRIQDRAFVLIPLADVAPNWRHPVLGKTVAEMLDTLPQGETDAVKALKTV